MPRIRKKPLTTKDTFATPRIPFSPELWERALLEMSRGKSLRTIEQTPGMPAMDAVLSWINSDAELALQYARAKEQAMTAMSEDIERLADNAAECTDPVRIQGLRLQLDAKKWLMSKLAPKRFGDKITTEVTGPGGEPLKLEQAPDAAAKILLGFAHATLPMRKDDG